MIRERKKTKGVMNQVEERGGKESKGSARGNSGMRREGGRKREKEERDKCVDVTLQEERRKRRMK